MVTMAGFGWTVCLVCFNGLIVLVTLTIPQGIIISPLTSSVCDAPLRRSEAVY